MRWDRVTDFIGSNFSDGEVAVKVDCHVARYLTVRGFLSSCDKTLQYPLRELCMI